ncbi:hypothetical protein KEM55_006718 [Ascosphaera atra]|nr:hypothetical protein KEM55_006718 [Ascosphaera atra]
MSQESIYPSFTLHDKVYVVTGGGRGIGLCIAEAMCQAGAKVHCFDLSSSPGNEFLAAQKRSIRLRGFLRYHCVDVRDEHVLDKTCALVADDHGRIDGLVAAAGIQQLTEALDYKPADARRMMDINFLGVLSSAQAVARQMIKRRSPGSMVLVASMSGFVANKGLMSCVYNSSKAAVIQLARNLAMEWGYYGIRVNSLCPGHTITPMVQQCFDEVQGLKELWEGENMLGHLARPHDLSGPAIFMLSDASRFMTGTSLLIDGGHTAW